MHYIYEASTQKTKIQKKNIRKTCISEFRTKDENESGRTLYNSPSLIAVAWSIVLDAALVRCRSKQRLRVQMRLEGF
jgi:hypothetical protein